MKQPSMNNNTFFVIILIVLLVYSDENRDVGFIHRGRHGLTALVMSSRLFVLPTALALRQVGLPLCDTRFMARTYIRISALGLPGRQQSRRPVGASGCNLRQPHAWHTAGYKVATAHAPSDSWQ